MNLVKCSYFGHFSVSTVINLEFPEATEHNRLIRTKAFHKVILVVESPGGINEKN